MRTEGVRLSQSHARGPRPDTSNGGKCRPNALGGRDPGSTDEGRQGSLTLKKPLRFDYAPSSRRAWAR
jgi:hypothetical protein